MRGEHVFVCVCALLASQVAQSQDRPIERAEGLYADGDLAGARAAFEEALRAGGHGPADVATIHLHLAVLDLGEGNPEAAREHLVVALAIDPARTMPDELSPDQRQVFHDVRRAQGEPLSVSVAVEGEIMGEEPFDLRLALQRAPEGAVRTLRLSAVSADGEATWNERVVPTTATVAVPRSVWGGRTTLDLSVEALDATDNVLARAQAHVETRTAVVVDSEPDPLQLDLEVEVEPESRHDVLSDPVFWLVTGGVVVLGVVIGVLALTAERRFSLETPTFGVGGP